MKIFSYAYLVLAAGAGASAASPDDHSEGNYLRGVQVEERALKPKAEDEEVLLEETQVLQVQVGGTGGGPPGSPGKPAVDSVVITLNPGDCMTGCLPGCLADNPANCVQDCLTRCPQGPP